MSSASGSQSDSKSSRRIFDPTNPRSERGREELRRTEEELRPPVVEPRIVNFFQTPIGMVVGVMLCIIFAMTVKFIQVTNILRVIEPHNVSECRVVRGPIGAEDVVLDRRAILLISSDARTWVPYLGRDGFTDAEEARRRIAAMPLEESGSIWAYDTRSSAVSTTAGEIAKLEIEGMPTWIKDFHPHGIAVPRPIVPPTKTESDYPVFLYVVNHARDGDQVVAFEVIYTSPPNSTQVAFPPKLAYRAVLTSEELISANDLEALYPIRRPDGTYLHSVYVTNFLGTSIGHTVMNLLESALLRPWGSVVACQGVADHKHVPEKPTADAACMTVIPKVSGPNGIALSPDRTALYVAKTFEQKLETYLLPTTDLDSRRITTPGLFVHGHVRMSPLTHHASVMVATSPDNLSLDETTGDIIFGAHPKLLDAQAHLEDPANHIAPSQAVRFTPPAGEERRIGQKSTPPSPLTATAPARHTLREIHLNHGDVFPGSSVAVWNRPTKEVIMGGVAADGIFICPYDGQ